MSATSVSVSVCLSSIVKHFESLPDPRYTDRVEKLRFFELAGAGRISGAWAWPTVVLWVIAHGTHRLLLFATDFSRWQTRSSGQSHNPTIRRVIMHWGVGNYQG